MQTDNFGFLPIARGINFDGGTCTVLPTFADTWTAIQENAHRDGFLYPPETTGYRAYDVAPGDRERVPHTTRPTPMFKLGPSHQLTLDQEGDRDDLRKRDAGFILHFLAYLFGYELQFHDWWFVSRIPIKSQHSATVFEGAEAAILSKAYSTWKAWSPTAQKRVSNLLYLTAHIPSYEWPWERFLLSYMVFDGCFRLAADLHHLSQKMPHRERFTAMCTQFNLCNCSEQIDRIYTLRNELFHEALWGGETPGNLVDTAVYYAGHYLRAFIQRLLAAVLGFSNDYVQSRWDRLASGGVWRD